MSERTVEHVPNIEKIPNALRSLNWQPMPPLDDVLWHDCSQLMVAVPVKGDGSWYYEISIVTIKCGEDYFDLESNGDHWGWSMGDIDWFVALGDGPFTTERTVAIEENTDLAQLRKDAERCKQLEQENIRLRKILSHVPARIAIKAKEDAGFGNVITANGGQQ